MVQSWKSQKWICSLTMSIWDLVASEFGFSPRSVCPKRISHTSRDVCMQGNGIRPAVALMCKLTPVWRGTPQLLCQTHCTAGTSSPHCRALGNLLPQASNLPRASETLDPSSMDQNTQSWLHARAQGFVGVLCPCIHFQAKHITPSFGCQTFPIMREQ